MKQDNTEDSNAYGRREFLVRASAAAVIAATATAGGLMSHVKDVPNPDRRSHNRESEFAFRNYQQSDLGKIMAIVRNCAERRKSVGLAFDALGGIGKFVSRGDVVLLKPNIAFASPPRFSATTHPDLLEALIMLCKDAGASEVRITDNPINDPDNCFRLSGLAEVARRYNVKLIAPHGKYFKNITLPNARLIKNWPVLAKPFEEVTRVFGVSPVKDHTRSGASLSMKNWYGLLGGRRNIFHQDISGIIVELAGMIQPTAVVLDGTSTMMTNGPTGGSGADLKPTNTMILSTDMVAADAYATTMLLERDLGAVPWIEKAQDLGIGTADWKSLSPVFCDAASQESGKV